MYLPDHFEEKDIQLIKQIIAEYPFAHLIANADQGMIANSLPLLQDGADKLIGHIAIKNDLHNILPDGAEVLVIFQGVEGYISPNWYPTKAQHHKQVPTWNYQLVHIRGQIFFHHDQKTKRKAVGLLTKMMEERINGENAWRMADTPPDYMALMLDNIVAFEIKISSISAKSKLNQNKEPIDKNNVAKILSEGINPALGKAMEEKNNP